MVKNLNHVRTAQMLMVLNTYTTLTQITSEKLRQEKQLAIRMAIKATVSIVDT